MLIYSAQGSKTKIPASDAKKQSKMDFINEKAHKYMQEKQYEKAFDLYEQTHNKRYQIKALVCMLINLREKMTQGMVDQSGSKLNDEICRVLMKAANLQTKIRYYSRLDASQDESLKEEIESFYYVRASFYTLIFAMRMDNLLTSDENIKVVLDAVECLQWTTKRKFSVIEFQALLDSLKLLIDRGYFASNTGSLRGWIVEKWAGLTGHSDMYVSVKKIKDHIDDAFAGILLKEENSNRRMGLLLSGFGATLEGWTLKGNPVMNMRNIAEYPLTALSMNEMSIVLQGILDLMDSTRDHPFFKKEAIRNAIYTMAINELDEKEAQNFIYKKIVMGYDDGLNSQALSDKIVDLINKTKKTGNLRIQLRCQALYATLFLDSTKCLKYTNQVLDKARQASLKDVEEDVIYYLVDRLVQEDPINFTALENCVINAPSIDSLSEILEICAEKGLVGELLLKSAKRLSDIIDKKIVCRNSISEICKIAEVVDQKVITLNHLRDRYRIKA